MKVVRYIVTGLALGFAGAVLTHIVRMQFGLIPYDSVLAVLVRCVALLPCALWIDWHLYERVPGTISVVMCIAFAGAAILTRSLGPDVVSLHPEVTSQLTLELGLAIINPGVPGVVLSAFKIFRIPTLRDLSKGSRNTSSKS